MSEKAMFTIVIPCYNQSAFLGDCLESLRAQTYPFWTAFVVDDGSTDGQAIGSIISKFGDPRCTLLQHSSNKGLAASRNTGFSTSVTPYVVPVDSDDMIAPNYLEYAAGIFGKDDHVDCVFADFKLFGAREEIRKYSLLDDSAFARVQWIPGAGVAMRRTLWEAVGGYCEAPELRYGNEDWDFWLGAAQVGFRAAHVPEPLYYYRQHAESLMRCLAYHDYKTREFIYRRHSAWFEKNGASDDFRAAGYLNSASDSLRRGERFRAFALSAKALLLSPSEATLKAILRPAFPEILRAPLAAVFGRYHNGART